ncbi:putative permease for cytosine/purines, uracil, thiamine, allantoin [Lyophyllum shimeji]|uniref:Permease for cytosine/purines, uracil, thiamine, allantoin n=1 Tax=Lyophyllum shimeji TaxID=47721 RepID=A0A9P3PPF7_LYOSH|nr:putative permease for cytosine/purines, uracil, thiamine, allantoin [Lyophyllum shimeji]
MGHQAPSTSLESAEGLVDDPKPLSKRITSFLLQWGVETHGISPIPMEQRLDKRLYQMFSVWFSANFNILAFSTGSAGPAFFSLGLRDTLVILLVVDAVACAVPALFAVFGPKLGTRGMVQARFSWGYYGSMIPSILNVISMQGFLILNCIIGGQTLASVSDRLDDTAGIVIIGVLSLVVTFFGYKVVHWYESLAWIPNVVAFVVMLGVGGKHLRPSNYPSYPTPSAATVLSFVTFIASSVISWCTMTPDYGVYHNAKASSLRIFTYTYLGFFFASIVGHMLGAAFAAMAPAVPSWQAGFKDGSNVGGLIAAVLSPAGGFGKFLMVLISLSIPSACAPTMYTFGTSFMSVAPLFARVPRYVFAIISAAILIPIAIVGATRFYGTLVNVLSIIGYWSTAFAAIVLTEHFFIRRGDFLRYSIEDWDKARRLPPGIAAVVSFAGAFGIIVPSMSQVWYVGPIARAGTGDIGVFTGFTVAAVLYMVLRPLEQRLFQRTI